MNYVFCFCYCFIYLFQVYVCVYINIMPRRIPDFPDSFYSWKLLLVHQVMVFLSLGHVFLMDNIYRISFWIYYQLYLLSGGHSIILQMLFSFILLSINLIIIWYCIFLWLMTFWPLGLLPSVTCLVLLNRSTFQLPLPPGSIYPTI